MNESVCVSEHVIGVERQKQGHRKRGRGRDRWNEKNNNVESESCKGSERKSWLRSYVTIKHVTRRRREKIIEILCSQNSFATSEVRIPPCVNFTNSLQTDFSY